MKETGQPFFWLGDTAWLLLTKRNREEAETYLKNRRRKGFNVIQVMVLQNILLVNGAEVASSERLDRIIYRR